MERQLPEQDKIEREIEKLPVRMRKPSVYAGSMEAVPAYPDEDGDFILVGSDSQFTVHEGNIGEIYRGLGVSTHLLDDDDLSDLHDVVGVLYLYYAHVRTGSTVPLESMEKIVSRDQLDKMHTNPEAVEQR